MHQKHDGILNTEDLHQNTIHTCSVDLGIRWFAKVSGPYWTTEFMTYSLPFKLRYIKSRLLHNFSSIM